MRYARGQCAVLIDSDLQDPPAMIPEMYRLWQQGYQLVYGVRSKRNEETALRTDQLAVLPRHEQHGQD